MFLAPYVNVRTTNSIGPILLTRNTPGLGDTTIGNWIQYRDFKLLGKPYHFRVEVDVTVPSGKYDKMYLVNPGFNLYMVEVYYAWTWLFADKWETSGRLHYTYNSENKGLWVKPGKMVHCNFAISREILPKFRVGGGGYFLRQFTCDKYFKVKARGTHEQVIALGPGIVYQNEDILLLLDWVKEFAVRNRFQGSRATMQLFYQFK